MERVKLLSTDQSSSEVRMTATGQANHTGSTRTRAAKGLFSHFMLLAGVLLIALFTSSTKAYTYTITLAGEEATSHLTITQTDETTATITASSGYALPATLTGVEMNGETPLSEGEGSANYSYDSSTGEFAIDEGTTVNGNIVITATALSTNATLTALTYQLGSTEAVSVNGFAAATDSYELTDIPYTKEATVTLNGTPATGATITTNEAADITKNEQDGTQTATATILVTAADGETTKTYTVSFAFKQDELTEVTAPVVSAFGAKMADAEAAVAALKANNLTAAITTVSGATYDPLAVTWTYDKSKNNNVDYVSTAGTKHKFTWTVTLPVTLANTANTALTGEVEITNAAASTENKLTTLTYQLPSGVATNVKENVGDDTETPKTYEVTLPFGTAADAVVTVAATASDYATITVASAPFNGSTTVTLNEGKGELVLTVTSESNAARTVTIKFAVAEAELITKIEGIEDLVLPQAVTSSDDVIAWLEENVHATIISNGPSAFKVKWEYKESSNGSAPFNPASTATNKFDWKIVYADEDKDATGAPSVEVAGTITVTNHTTSTDAKLSKLEYKIGDNDAVNIEIGEQNDNAIAITVPAFPFGTTAITLLATANDPFATVTEDNSPAPAPAAEVSPVSFPVEISAAGTTFKLKVTAEDNTTKVFTLTFSVDKEKVTAVSVPDAYKLPKVVASADEAITLLADMKDVVITTSGNTPMKLVWTYETSKNTSDERPDGAFSATGGATNIFSWAVKTADDKDMDAEGVVALTGTTTVTNLNVITGTEKTVEITKEKPVDEIGDGTTETAIETVTVAAAAEQLTINNAAITTSLILNESVAEIVLNKADIKEIILADAKETTLALQEGSTIEKITNNGTMTLTNAAAVSAASYLSMPVETKAAALANSGAVEAVDNNGTFTDETATIVTVGGDADLRIIDLPKSQSTTGSSATLAVTAETTNGEISYQWQKYTDKWENVTGTTESLKIDKKQNGATKYRCEVKSINTDQSATTTLYTPEVSVTIKSAGDPTPSDPTPTPSVKTYTVTLKKVTGATFSQGETTKVDEGDDFSFTIKLDKDYDQSKPVVKVGTTTYEPDTKGVYTIKNITKDITIEVSGIVKNTSTGIEETTEDAVRVWSEGSTLYIHTPQAADVYVVSGAGALMRELKAVPGDQNMQLPAGFYIVRVGTYTAKVIIR